MTHADRSDRRARVRGSAALIVSLVALVGLLVPLLLDSSANAASLRTGSVSAATKTCPTDPYTSSTVAECGTTTTTPAVTIKLRIGYRNGTITWEACGYPSTARGSLVQLYLDGQPIIEPGGSAPVRRSGCAGASFSLCLVRGSYSAVAVNPFGQASSTMTVHKSGCSNPITLASSSGAQSAQTKSKSSGALAFTGSNVLILLLAALLLIVLGYAIVRINRQRRHAG